jgi:hypothetical protein
MFWFDGVSVTVSKFPTQDLCVVASGIPGRETAVLDGRCIPLVESPWGVPGIHVHVAWDDAKVRLFLGGALACERELGCLRP